MKYKLKSIGNPNGNPVGIQLKWKSIGNPVEISLKLKWKSIEIPVQIQQKFQTNTNLDSLEIQ